ncbi:unnamed protein product, partial [Ectocarpus sp. 12 AP-2014]
SKDFYESVRSRTGKCFVSSKEHCRRPHVPSSLEINASLLVCVICLSWLTPPAACLFLTELAASMVQWAGSSVAGRAPALQAGGHRFDPDRLHQSFFY